MPAVAWDKFHFKTLEGSVIGAMSLTEETPCLNLTYAIEDWPILGSFSIARGTKSVARVIVATLSDGEIIGRGECVPYPRYGESTASVCKQIENMVEPFRRGLNHHQLNESMPAGAARNALDCALWDFMAKFLSKPVYQLAGLKLPEPAITAYTIGLDTPASMSAKASEANADLLKLKLGGQRDHERMQMVRSAVPDARLIVDANEGWGFEELPFLLSIANELDIEMVEQPLPADQDYLLEQLDHVVPIVADESIHDIQSIEKISSRYDAINVKLDKTGGLSGAIELLNEAKDLGLGIMIGCMVSTSLSMAPAALLTASADWIDLDGPLLLSRDREPGMKYDGYTIYPPISDFWG